MPTPSGIRVFTPASGTLSKTSSGLSDLYIASGVYKLNDCSVLSLNMSLGYNGTASSVSLNLVQDTYNGDNFVPPTIPSIWAVSLPSGGVGAPIFYGDPLTTLHQIGFDGGNVPFYFAGICNDFKVGLRNSGGNSISFSIVDPKEVLRGVQCLLSGFALSQQIGAGAEGNDPRFSNVNNVIDVFGYWNYGMESERNEYGMPWNNIKTAIESVRVTIKDMDFEFVFTGEGFTDAPSWYRVDDEIIDLISLCQKVADDSGSDFIAVGRKTDANVMLVEFRSIRRTKDDALTQGELAAFISSRTDIVESVNAGREFRNEPDSSIVIGGMRNSNYVAYPSEYNESMHLTSGKEDYNAFPPDIKIRLFGGSGMFSQADADSVEISQESRNYTVRSGAIFPFWGFTPDDHAYPLIEPFISLDHLAFDRVTDATANVTERIPLCKISTKNFTVRNYPHTQVFLDGDQDPDDRPFAYLEEYHFASNAPSGYLRGLPLNTEVLRASLVSQEAFYNLYSLYYPDICDQFGLPSINYTAVSGYVDGSDKPDLFNFRIDENLYAYNKLHQDFMNNTRNPDGTFNASAGVWANIDDNTKEIGILDRFLSIMYEEVHQYALDCLGRRYIVCLPKSAIMQRIWNNLPVPTRPEKPQIEYIVDNVGYWELVPEDLDGIVNVPSGGLFDGSQEDQIRRKFMAEDGRFYPMVEMQFQPSGNINFNSNGLNRAMFQDFPVSEFRPNRIADSDHNPEHVYISCQVNSLSKRPDLAIVTMPGQITFDPTVANRLFREWDDGSSDDEFIATKTGIMNYFWYLYKKHPDFRSAIFNAATKLSITSVDDYAKEVFTLWAFQIYNHKNEWYKYENSTEIIMDVSKIIIPLTSTWSAYGPYYYTYDDAKGMVNIQVDDTLVPWNFARPAGSGWYQNLDAAGFERLGRTLADIDYLDSASLTVVGFPEFGPASDFGYNSNVTGISVDFGAGGIRTTYNLSTYAARPGTYRKGEYDNLSRARIDTREKLPDPENINIVHDVFAASNDRNKFPY